MDVHNGAAEGLGAATERMYLEPYKSVILLPDNPLANEDKVADEFGLGFKASLRGILQLAPYNQENTNRLYIFDRGKNETDMVSVVKLHETDKTTTFVKDRFVVIDQRTMDDINTAAAYQYNFKHPYGFRGFSTGASIILGRNLATQQAFGGTMIGTVSRNHAQLNFDDDGKITITDLGSSNGTWLEKVPIQPEGAAFVDAESQITTIEKPSGPLTLRDIGQIVVESAQEKYFSVGVADKPLRGEDTILSMPDRNLFGIFDGAGGVPKAIEASQLASRIVGEEIGKVDNIESYHEAEELLRKSFIRANDEVIRSRAGLTTGVVVKIAKYQDEQYASWVSVGDSRLYLFNRNKTELVQVTKDESEAPKRPNVLTNAIGSGFARIHQLGSIKLQAGDELILCSDGITGDWLDELMSDDEIKYIMKNSPTTQQAADKLLLASKKRDDKSVLVIRP
jgi:serine/threonine protein phosphatase PrpC